LLAVEQRIAFRTIYAWLALYIINLFVGTVFAGIIEEVKVFGMEALNTSISSEIFLLRGAFTLVDILVVDLLERTHFTVLNLRTKKGVISRTWWAPPFNDNRGAFRTSWALILIDMIDKVLLAWLALTGGIVEVLGEVASDTSLWAFKW
jgi:hypothetical protein